MVLNISSTTMGQTNAAREATKGMAEGGTNPTRPDPGGAGNTTDPTLPVEGESGLAADPPLMEMPRGVQRRQGIVGDSGEGQG